MPGVMSSHSLYIASIKAICRRQTHAYIEHVTMPGCEASTQNRKIISSQHRRTAHAVICVAQNRKSSKRIELIKLVVRQICAVQWPETIRPHKIRTTKILPKDRM